VILALLALLSAACGAPAKGTPAPPTVTPLPAATPAPTVTPVPPVPLTIPGLVLYYPFNGDTRDQSPHQSDGQVGGAVLTADRFGVANRAYSFDGVDDDITFDTSRMPLGADARTISAWIKAESFPPAPESFQALGSRATVIGWGEDEPFQLSEMQIVDNRLSFHNYTCDLASQGRVELQQWYHLVIVYTGQKTRLYINGQRDESASCVLRTVNGTGRIGAFCDPTRTSQLFPHGYDLSYFHGVIDDVAVYDHALTEEQVLLLYHEGGWE